MTGTNDDAPIEPTKSDESAPDVGGAKGPVHAPSAVAVQPAVVDAPARDDAQPEERWNTTIRDIVSGNAMVSVLAVLASFVVGGILIISTNEDVQEASGYFFARPADTLQAAWNAVFGAYSALFQGSVLNFARADAGFAALIKPLTETMHFAAPLIAAGLGVAVAFRTGMFNIGGKGQMLAASLAAGFVGFAIPMPPVIHIVVAIVAGMTAGALWGGVAGFLKARTGAHEVITTIMLNFVAFWFLSYLIRVVIKAPGSNNPVTPATLDTAVLPPLFGAQFNVTWGFVLSVLAVVFYWWFIEHSSLGYRFRTVGLNVNAALNAGMNVKLITVQAMLLAGAFMGLAGAQQVQSTVTTGFTSSIDSNIGFDAITVALLGRSSPWGTLAAGLLFGAFKAGGYRMQASEGVPIDIVLVVQSMIVLFIAAPPLVRTIFFLPKPRSGGAR